MFGDRKELILPLVLDIANLVRMAAESNDAAPLARSTRQTLAVRQQHESLPSAEFLRAEPNAQPRVLDSAMHDDRFSVDVGEDDVKIKHTSDTQINEGRAFHVTRSAPFYDHLLKKMVPNVRSAMAPKKHPILQRRVDSGIPPRPPSNLPLNQKPFVVPSTTITPMPETTPFISSVGNGSDLYNEVEDLALNSLNGTYIGDSEAQATDTGLESEDAVDENEDDEQLPTAEKLIGGRYRKKPHSRYSHRKPGLSLSSASLCEKFTGSVCLRVEDYPMLVMDFQLNIDFSVKPHETLFQGSNHGQHSTTQVRYGCPLGRVS